MNTNDEKLLHAAALEAGFADIGGGASNLMAKRVGDAIVAAPWNPLEGTEEALHLAAKLKMTITFGEGAVVVNRGDHSCVEDLSKGPAAVRRAIVVVAAGVGNLPR